MDKIYIITYRACLGVENRNNYLGCSVQTSYCSVEEFFAEEQ